MINFSNLIYKFIIPSIFLIFSLFNCATNVEFIPDSNYTEENQFYSKTNPTEVELTKERPRKDFRFVGTVIVRNFNSSKIETEILQKEMFRLKIDGVLVKKSFVDSVAPVVLSSKSNDGMLLGYQETNNEMGKLIGYPFRYMRR